MKRCRPVSYVVVVAGALILLLRHDEIDECLLRLVMLAGERLIRGVYVGKLLMRELRRKT